MREPVLSEVIEVIDMLVYGYANGMTDLQVSKALFNLNKLRKIKQHEHKNFDTI